MSHFVDVILPLPIAGTFTYSLGETQVSRARPGMRVAVPFGKGKTQTGLLYAIHRDAPEHYEAKPVYYLLDDEPIVYPLQLEFWVWMASYYGCKLGEVYRAALPSALRLDSEMLIRLGEAESPPAQESLSRQAQEVLDALQPVSSLALSELEKRLGRAKCRAAVQQLLQLGLVAEEEQITERYSSLQVRLVKLCIDPKDPSALEKSFRQLARAPKQKAVFLYLIREKQRAEPAVKLKTLLRDTGAGHQAIRALVDKGILQVWKQPVDRQISPMSEQHLELKGLSPAQQASLEAIRSHFKERDVVLLKGVTGSGKTEVYTYLIQEQLESDKQVLFLLPEIALTHAFIHRIKAYFGEAVGVFTSHYNANERVELWNSVQDGRFKIVVSARSGLFLPFQNLGLVIVDESHEPSYKQQEPAPRYHARDAALVLARLYAAKTLLGSATPMVETYARARAGDYGLVELNRRFNDVPLPRMQAVDLAEARAQKRLKGPFSEVLLERIAETLTEGKQVLLFQNRRGYASVLECPRCGTAPQCPRCDVSLTYHAAADRLRCHYCGYAQARPQRCLACGAVELDYKGLGTEQLEMALKALFPEARIDRMDRDSTRRKKAFEAILSKFQNQQTDILIGTQMIAKGLDFNQVRLVGIIQVDGLLNYPDFRAHERAFQLLTQVAGRAGRKGRQGLVILQSYRPQHRVIRQLIEGDYQAMYAEQLAEREAFLYPPYARLIQITLKHRRQHRVEAAAQYLSDSLRVAFQNCVLGPEMPLIARIRNRYLYKITIKIPRDFSLQKSKRFLAQKCTAFEQLKAYRSVQVVLDVDPQ